MFPTVAPFPSVQPHHHLQSYPTHDNFHQSSYDVNDPKFPAHNDPSKPFLDPSRSRLQLPHPVQRLDSRDVLGTGLSANNPGEHALRRKTPNGTLAAGYDGTPGESTIQPATKHILVSPMDVSQYMPPQPALQPDIWQPPAIDPTSTHMNFPPVFKNDGNAMAAGEVVQDANGTSWVRPVNYPQGMDSVLNQSLPLQAPHRFLLHNGAYIPTVLPATLQQCVGPTASAGTGPFGPYWPDGAYIPYRPVAFREPRFESPNPNSQSLFGPQQPIFNQPQIPLGNHADPSLSWGPSQPGLSGQSSMMKPHFPPRHSDQHLPYHARAHRSLSSYSSNNLNQEPLPWNGRPSGLGLHTPGPAVPVNMEFKEKILSWAHGVYVDLLATIHQARRSSASNPGSGGQNPRFMKPTIYPKPPRQPGLDFSQNAVPELSRHNSYPSSQYDLQQQKLGFFPGSGLNDSNQKPGHGQIHNRRPSLNQFSHQRGSDASMRDAGLFSGMPSHSRFSGGLFNEGSPVNNAMTALEMLSHLCMESRWEWIDGMLLGGCLAYGLGDYQKALRWYSRIIARDST